MKPRLTTCALVGAALLLFAPASLARIVDEAPERQAHRLEEPLFRETDLAPTRLETLWIFDADFSDLVGDNAGWTAHDRSGTLGVANCWHHDTIRINGFTHLGDSTWWCGTYNDCWCQPRGYGNDWTQILERHFTEASGLTGTLTLEYDQRFAMEKDYDYGYVDIRSSATGDTWLTVAMVNNPGFAGTPGMSQDWDSVNPAGGGHMSVDISPEAMGVEFDLRFRFESDGAYSSQDEYNTPPLDPVLDGAWQLDNITLKDDGVPIFTDDAESGDPWTHDDVITSGQIGTTFWRGQYGIDFVTGRGFTCDERPVGSWMYAAVDPFTSTMVDGEHAWLVSPPIDISGGLTLIGQWDQWVDLPRPTNDIFNLSLASNDLYACVTDPAGFADESPGWWYGGPFWGTWTDDWGAFAGNDWLAIRWELENSDPPSEPHMGGIFVNRQKVGFVSGDPGTQFTRDQWNSFHDWFQDDLAGALEGEAQIQVSDNDGISSLYLVASNDGGSSWNSYACAEGDPDHWTAPPPTAELVPQSVIWYYYEATNGAANVSVYPPGAPDDHFEMSILPINGSIASPGILLVDKHNRNIPGEHRDYGVTAQQYYEEALSELGYDWDVYDVEVPSGTTAQSDGPDASGYKYYDTQIWFTHTFDTYTIKRYDQANLIQWLGEGAEGKERNLLLTGNNISYELITGGLDTLGFFGTWLASEFVSDGVGVVTVDSVPGLIDYAGGYDFVTDGGSILQGGCPVLAYFDVIQPAEGVAGAELVAEYEKLDMSRLPVGVAYTHATDNYQTVNLGFGIEFMVGDLQPNGYFADGSSHRKDLLWNILNYFGKTSPQTYLVKDDGTGDFATIQDALNTAADGDTIELAAGTFTGAGNRDIDFGGKAVVLRSQDGDPMTCMIDCESAAQGFVFASGETLSSVVKDITVTNGAGVFGGAVTCTGASPTLIGCRFVSNSATEDGGALYGSNSSVTVDACLFLNNLATDDGGAAKFEVGSSPAFTDCEFIGNTVVDDAGAVQTYASTPSFDHCLFAENQSGDHATLIIGEDSGGAVTSCTFVANEGGTSGCSGIAVQGAGSTCDIDNTIIALGTYGEAVFEATGGIATLTCSDLYGNSGGDWIDGIADQLGIDGNFSEDPMFCDPTGGYYELHVSSPCADAPACGLVGALGVGCGYEWLVNPEGTGDFPTIQDAVNAVAPGDTIELASGTFTGTGNRDIDFLGKAIVLRSAAGDPDLCTIDCEDAGRAFYFHSGEDTTTVVMGITIRNGNMSGFEERGAAVFCDASSPKFVSMVMTEGVSFYGGGMSCLNGSAPVLDHVVFSNNYSSHSSGGMQLTGPAVLRYVDFLSNESDTYGGAMEVGSDGAPILRHCTFVGNDGEYGGAIACNSTAAPALIDCVLKDNVSSLGGGMYLRVSSAPVLENVAIVGNTATQGGGIYVTETAWPTLTEVTLAANTAPVGGGTIYVDTSAGATIENTIIAQNIGEAIFCAGGASPTTTHSCVYGNTVTDTLCGPHTDNLFLDPLFCDPLAGEFTVSDASPCLPANNGWGVQVGAYGAGCGRIWQVPDDVPTIAAAMDSASAGDIVEVACGTYFEHDIQVVPGITLRSATGESDCVTIDCEELGRGLFFASSVDTTTIVRGFSIIDGIDAQFGGGIFCDDGADPILEDILIVSCQANRGGGMFVDGPSATSPKLANVTFFENYATDQGGGIYCNGASRPRLRNVTLYGNSADTAGGGVYLDNTCSPLVMETIIAFGSGGGAFFCESGTGNPTIVRSCSYGNVGGDALCGDDPDNIFLDPDFCDPAALDLTLAGNSPCLPENNAWNVLIGANGAGGCRRIWNVPAEVATISAAMDSAAVGDTVVVACGTYYEYDIQVTPGITLRGETGDPSCVTIDCGSLGRGLYFSSAVDTTTIVRGLTVTNAHNVSHGGGIICDASSKPKLEKLWISSCEADFGGGMYTEGNGGASSPKLSNVTFFDNRASGNGGAIYCNGPSNPRLQNVTIARNAAGGLGGGIYLDESCNPLIIETIVAYSDTGAAFFCEGEAATIVRSCSFGNEGGDGVCGDNPDNIFADPLFCDLEGGDLTLRYGSPCLPDYNSWGVQVGAHGAGVCGRIWHVPADAPTIAAGIDSASAGDLVEVACGTYYEHSIQMKSGIALRSETGDPACVTIDAQGLGRVIACDAVDATSLIEGFTITGGVASSDGGGGIRCSASSPWIVNCVLDGNNGGEWGGGASCIQMSSPSLDGCVFSGNQALHGGGLYLDNSSAPNVAGCLFVENTSSFGAGVHCSTLTAPDLTNVTFVNNTSSAIGAAVTCGDQSTPDLTNIIIAGTIGGSAINCMNGGTVTLVCSDIYDNAGGDFVDCIATMEGVGGNFSEDPLFCDTIAGDYHLRDASPCADAPGCGLVGALDVGCTQAAPQIVTVPVTDGEVWRSYTYDVDASGYPEPIYALTEAPEGMTVDDTTGLIEWVPESEQVGLNDVTVTATNVVRGTDTQNFQVDVVPFAGPIVEGAVLTSTSGNGYTTDDLVVTYDLAGSATTAAAAWRMTSTRAPLMTLLMPMEGGEPISLDDYSGSGNHGATYGDPTWMSTAGHDGHGCYYFDGDDHVDAGSCLPLTAYTKTAWVNWEEGEPHNNIISGEVNHTFWIHSYGGGMRLTSGHNGNWDAVVDPLAFTPDAWTFVVVTYDASVVGGTMVLYRNGTEVDRAIGVTAINESDDRVFIGGYSGVCCWFKGWIDDPRLYDRALSEEQIAALYSGGDYDPNTIVSEETSTGDDWYVEVTPFSDVEAGVPAVSETLTIVNEPVAPLIVTEPDTMISIGIPYVYDVDATGWPEPTYSLDVWPSGMTIDDVTGLVEWTPLAGQEGDASITVVVANGVSPPDSQAFTIHVGGIPECPAGLVHYWKLDESEPGTYEDYYAGTDATCTSCPMPVAGVVENGQWFDGLDDEVTVPDDGSFDWGATDSFTMECWMQTSESLSEDVVLIGRDDSGSQLHIRVGCRSDSVANFTLIDIGGDGAALAGGNPLIDGEPHHIAAVRDVAADSIKLYVDGVLITGTDDTSVAGFGGDVPLDVGYLNLDGHYRYHGLLDEIAMHNRALSPSEIRDHHSLGLAGLQYFEHTQQRYLVKADGTGDFPTIQDAVNATANGDTIELADGTFTGPGNRDVEFLGKDLTLRSQNGNPAACVIDCESSGRGFYLHVGDGAGSTLTGFTIANGSAIRGGGMLCESSAPELANLVFLNNEATGTEGGGGIYLASSSPSLTGILFDGNTTAASGAGVHCGNSSPVISYTQFLSNVAVDDGGAVYCRGSASLPTLDHCTLVSNECSYGGAGVTCSTFASVELSNCIVAFSITGKAVACSSGCYATISCSNVYGNVDGDYVDCIEGQNGVNGNFSEDPLFCNPGGGDYHLDGSSPCVDAPGCGLVGTLGIGCGRIWQVPSGVATIAAAMDSAGVGDEVVVECGTYTEHSIQMKSGVTLRSETGEPDCVTIDASGSGFAVIECSSVDAAALIEGLTLTGGEDSGINLSGSSPSIVNCVISDNTWDIGPGGGVTCRDGSSPEITDCLFLVNTGTSRGGGLFSTASSPTLDSCIFAECAADTGGAVLCEGGSLVSLTNCTVTDNSSSGEHAGVIGLFGASTIDITDSIVALNAAGPAVYCEAGSAANLTCTDVYGNPGGDFTGCIAGQEGTNGNISEDPVFCDAGAGNYQLHYTSPCADADGCGLIGAFGIGCGRDWYVPTDLPTIAAAIDSAQPGDAVIVECGTYYESNLMEGLTKGITIRSETGDPSCVTIDAGELGPVFRAIGISGTLVVTGVTMTGGLHGVECVGSSAEFVDCIFRNNTAVDGSGGGAEMAVSDVSFTRCVFEHCSANAGGALWCEGSTVVLGECTISDNTAVGGTGGAIGLAFSSSADLTNCIVAFSSSGEAIHCDTGGTANLVCTDVYGNAGGDFVGCLAGFEGVDGNFSEDPVFCDRDEGRYTLHVSSPCADVDGCGRVGAHGVQCGRVWDVPLGVGTIAAAVDSAAAGDTVLIACGTYDEYGIQIPSGIVFRSETQEPDCVTIDAGGLGPVIEISAADTTTFIQGITLTGGYGSGAYLTASAPQFESCVFFANSSGGESTFGGGMYCGDSSSPNLTDCVFEGNTAGSLSAGGGLFCDGSSASLTTCLFAQNAAEGGGGAILADAASSLTLTNCTLVENDSGSPTGGGIEAGLGSTVDLAHCIIAFGSVGQAADCTGGTVTLTCSDVYGNAAGDYVGCISGQLGVDGNITEDPVFCGTENLDEPYALRSDSPCVEHNSACGQMGAFGLGCISDIVWDGGGSAARGFSWSDPLNWNPDRVPGPNDHAKIIMDGTYTVDLAAAAEVWALTHGATSGIQTLDILSNPLAVTHGAVNTSEITVRSGASLEARQVDATSVITNNPGGLVTLDGGDLIGAGSFVNSGDVFKTGLGTSHIGLTFLNDVEGAAGYVSVEAGTLSIDGEFDNLSRMVVNSGATAIVGAHFVERGSRLVTFTNYRTLTVDGSLLVDGDFENLGRLVVNSGATAIVSGHFIERESRAASFSNADPGTVAVGGSLFVEGDFENLGRLVVNSGGTAIVSGHFVEDRLPVGGFDNSGTVSIAAGGQFTTTGAGSVTTTGTFEVGGTTNVESGGDFVNLGSTIVTAGGDFLASGAIANEQGADFTNMGATIIVAGGQFLNTGLFDNRENALFGGSGTFDTSSGLSIMKGVISPGASHGTLSFVGDLIQSGTSEIHIEVGGHVPGDNYDVLDITGIADLNGAISLTFDEGFVPVVGDSFVVIVYSERSARPGEGFDCLSGLVVSDSLYMEPDEQLAKFQFLAVSGPIENDAPVAVDDADTVVGYSPITVAVLGNDTDPNGDELWIIEIFTSETDGLATIEPGDSLVSYIATPGFEGLDGFDYTVTDCVGGVDTAHVSIEVVAPPRAWHVPGDVATIQGGIDAASPGDTVMIACGTYYESGMSVPSGIIVESETGDPECVIIDASGRTGSALTFVGVDSTAVVRGLTITGGSSPDFGGGLYLISSSPRIEECTFLGNSAQSGGAVACADTSAPILVGCVFSGNSGDVGAAVACLEGSSPLLEHCLFIGNTSTTGGGGIACAGASSPTLRSCTLSGNSAPEGAGVYSGDGSMPTLERTIVAYGLGGEAVSCYGGGTAALSCSDVYGNTGGDWAGCIADQADTNENFSLDPQFCDADSANYFLAVTSPCADAQGCGLVGALPTGCISESEIVVSPDSLVFVVEAGAVACDQLVVTNDGRADLVWSIRETEGGAGACRGGSAPFDEQLLLGGIKGGLKRYADERIHIELAKGERAVRVGRAPARGSGGPDAFGYKWTDSNEPGGPEFEWQDIGSIGTAVVLADDDSEVIPLPFAFPFYGFAHEEVSISSNGFLTFGGGAADYSNDPIPDQVEPNDLIAPFWADLNPEAGGTIHHFHDMDDDRFIVQYTGVDDLWGSGPSTFQVALSPDGTIRFQYLDMRGDPTVATVGIENASASVGLEVAFVSAYVQDSLAVLIEDAVALMTEDPPGGVLPGLATEVVDVCVDATGLPPDVYLYELVIESNDPNNPVIIVPISLTVPRPPDIDVYPLMITKIGAFDATLSDPLTLRNLGDLDLTWILGKRDGHLGRGEATEKSRAGSEPIVSGLDSSKPLLLDALSPWTVDQRDDLERSGKVRGRSSGGPDSYGYVWIDSDAPGGPSFEWRDITSVGTQVVLGDDDSATIEFPFPFTFYDSFVDESQLTIGSNGYLTFGSEATSGDNTPLPSAVAPGRLIAPFWDDLNPAAGGSVHYYHDLSDTSFIVQYTNVPRKSGEGDYTFEVVLHREPTSSTDVVLFQYLDMDGELDSATVGIENHDASAGLEIIYNAPYVCDSLAVSIEELYSWIDAVPRSRVIAGGDSVEVLVLSDCLRAPTGEHEIDLVFYSNDPDEPELVVEYFLTVLATGVDGGDELPAKLALRGNYPNPFNSVTVVRYDLPDVTKVDLRVYGLSGRLVRTLVDGVVQNAGRRSVVWDGRDGQGRPVGSGVYFYRLEAGGESFRKKMVLLK